MAPKDVLQLCRPNVIGTEALGKWPTAARSDRLSRTEGIPLEPQDQQGPRDPRAPRARKEFKAPKAP